MLAHNLLEAIARRMLAHDAAGPFGLRAILCVGEIGLAVTTWRRWCTCTRRG